MSVEKMAAWLDGNLSAHDMLETAAQIQGDPMLEEVVSMSDAIDCDIESFGVSGELLPEELLGNGFELPNPDRRNDFLGGRMLGEVCCSMPAPAMCDMEMTADVAAKGDADKKSLFDKIKDLFSGEDKD